MIFLLKKAKNRILNIFPEKVTHFEDSQISLPVTSTFYGDKDINLKYIRNQVKETYNDKEILEPILIASELYEAGMEDKEKFFISDREVQKFVFSSKWKAGWVLILGGKDQKQLIEKLKEKNFMVFTDLPEIVDTYYIGNRETSPIYFLQLMVRYGLIWGKINPGDDHEMGHFLEDDMPGFMIINEDLPPLKYYIALGLMKLGAPAIVPSSFPFLYGNRIVADNLEDQISRGISFSNLRMKFYKDEKISLPDYCNQAYAGNVIKEGKTWGGKDNSFFGLIPEENINKKEIKVKGSPEENMSILVEVDHEKLSDDLTSIIEKVALKSINYLSGITAFKEEKVFKLKTGYGVIPDANLIGEAIYWGIRVKYPRLEDIRITILFDENEIKEKNEIIREYIKNREKLIKEMTEENTEEFCVCTECRPFSLEHTCIITPDRKPMCSSRSYFTVKAGAFFGMSPVPYKRQLEKDIPLKKVFSKGKIINTKRGEYSGCNQVYKEMTSGKLEKVYLHSLREYPHTSCGCFQNLAFWIEEVKGIGIMSRDSEAVTPSGQTWEILANKAGGKQNDGITGVSLSYIRSTNFLKGDGGIENVVWVDSELYNKFKDCFSEKQKVATEKEVSSMEELNSYLTGNKD